MLKAAKANPWVWVAISGCGCVLLLFALWRSIVDDNDSQQADGNAAPTQQPAENGTSNSENPPAPQVDPPSQPGAQPESTRDIDPLQVAAALSAASEQLSERISKSVVRIDTRGSATTASRIEQMSRLFGKVNLRAGPQQGSGVIVDSSGYILTSYHVVWAADVILVGLPDGSSTRAVKVGYDMLTDLAVLKVDAEGLTPAKWGRSKDLHAGTLVWAIGNPFGFERSVTMGIISAIDRPGVGSTPYADLLQTDAAVNPGNSGGPLVNLRGEVIGINTAIVGEAYRGIGFAIPSDTAQSVYQQIRERKSVARGWLGVGLGKPTDAENAREHQGAEILELSSGSTPARAAGLRIGDVVLAWNDVPIRSPVQLSRLIAQTQTGTQVRVRIQRGGESITANVVVGTPP